MSNNVETNKRPIIITIICIYLILSIFIGVFSQLALASRSLLSVPNVLLWLNVALVPLQLAAVYGLWKIRRWGAYLLWGTAAVSILGTLITGFQIDWFSLLITLGISAIILRYFNLLSR